MNQDDMRLHRDDPDGTHLYQDFPCLHYALEYAATIYGENRVTLTRLKNSWHEDATTLGQLQAVAKMRWQWRNEDQRQQGEQAAMEAQPGYGTF